MYLYQDNNKHILLEGWPLWVATPTTLYDNNHTCIYIWAFYKLTIQQTQRHLALVLTLQSSLPALRQLRSDESGRALP